MDFFGRFDFHTGDKYDFIPGNRRRGADVFTGVMVSQSNSVKTLYYRHIYKVVRRHIVVAAWR